MVRIPDEVSTLAAAAEYTGPGPGRVGTFQFKFAPTNFKLNATFSISPSGFRVKFKFGNGSDSESSAVDHDAQ